MFDKYIFLVHTPDYKTKNFYNFIQTTENEIIFNKSKKTKMVLGFHERKSFQEKGTV